MRRFSCFILLSCLCLWSHTPLADNDAQREQQEQELKQVRQKIQQLQQRIRQDQQRKSDVEKKLRKVEVELGKLRKSIRKLNSQIKTNENRLSALKRQRSQLQTKLQQQRELLAKQLRSAYMTGNREQIKLILNQEDPAALSRLSTYFDYVNKARTEQIAATQATMAELLEVGLKIESNNKQLASLQAQHKLKLATLQSNRDTRSKVLATIQTELRQEGKKLSQLKRNEKEIEELIASLVELLADIPDTPIAQVDFSKLKGKLKWPTRGKPRNSFGAPRNVGDLKWHGLMLGAPAGREVKAVASGRVAFADWLRGFGLLVIIDHDNGYLSLYGHNSVLFAEAGDWVSQHQVISQVGDSGGLQQAGLYFELRHKGKPVNPIQWCVKPLG